jgi:hypothetical protein
MHRVLNLHQLYAFMVSYRICLPLANIYLLLLLFFIARQPLVGQGPLTIEASRSHSAIHTTLGRTSLDELPAYRRDHNWQHPTLTKDRHSCLEPAIPVSEWPHTKALERVATAIDLFFTVWNVILNFSIKCLLTHIMVNFYLKNA